MRSRTLLLAVLLTIGCVPKVWGETLTIDSYTPMSTNTTYDLTALGTLDWAAVGYSEKAGGTAIRTGDGLNGNLLPTTDGSAPYPLESWTNGEPASSGGAARSGGVLFTQYDFSKTYSDVVIDLPAGSSGKITALVTSWTSANFSATFADGTSAAASMGGAHNEVDLSYATTVAQTLTLTIDGGAGGNGGFRMVALTGSPVPEPGTLVLAATGLIGLLAYAWRKRK